MDRRGFLGGSDIPVILGLKPYGKTRYRLWLEKTGKIESQYPEPEDEPDYIKAGRFLEDGISQWFAHEAKSHVRKADITLLDRTYKFLKGQTDRLFLPVAADGNNDWGPLEIKNVTGFKVAAWSDGVPVFVQAQVEWYAGLLESPRWGVGALVGGNSLKWSIGASRPEVFSRMKQKAVEFWELVESDTSPLLEPEDNQTMRDLHKQSNGHSIALPVDMAEWDMQRLMAINRMAVCDADRDEAEAHIKQAMADAEKGMLPSGAYYSWKTGEDGIRRFRRGGER